MTLAVLLSGCSPGIYASGRFSEVLRPGVSRQTIRSAIGEPVESGTTAGRDSRLFPDFQFDRFIADGPVYDRYLTTGAAMGAAMTFGILEIASFPRAVAWKASSRGKFSVTVFYDPAITYEWHQVSKLEETE